MKRTICYIVGAVPTKLNFTPTEDDLVIGADRGYLTLREQGVRRDVVIGDFDSSHKPTDENVISLNPVKDDTDTVAAIRYALGRGYDRFCLYGVMGGRPDMTFASLQTLAFILGQGAKGIVCGDGNAVIAVRNGRIDFRPGTTGVFSVFSLDEVSKGVYITDAKYPLDDYTLTSDLPLGVSNEFTGGRTSVTVCEGTLLVFFPCESPDEVLYPW
ncbi:MAG: thiamine diphosphokinase [Clostridia bacterium]|nr:thiamine diphosphokinase [Clostridia bacterium]